MKKKNKQPITKNYKKTDIFDYVEEYLKKYERHFIIGILLVNLATILLLFDSRISLNGDDAGFLLRASEFIKNNIFPIHQAPLYCIVMGFPIMIFGLNIPVLKLINSVFYLAHIYVLYLAFRNRIPRLVLFVTLFITAVNSYIVYYAYQTYSEAFFLLLQSLFLFSFFKLIDIMDQKTSIKFWIPPIMINGFFIFCLTTTKNMAVVTILIPLIYMLFMKKFKYIIPVIFAFVFFQFIFEVTKQTFWDTDSIQIQKDASTLIQKDHYFATQGYEDLKGYINRFIGNSDIYLSKHLFRITGFKEHEDKLSDTRVTIILYVLYVILFIFYFRVNKYLFLNGIISAIFIGTTFFALQTMWDDSRVIMIYITLLIFHFFYGLYYVFKKYLYSQLQIVFILFLCYVSYKSTGRTMSNISENLETRSRMAKGNYFSGYTEDWSNYLSMAQWMGKNLPDTSKTACLRANLVFVYSGGKNLQGIYTAPATFDPDSTLAYFKINNVTHVLMGSLRKYPSQKTPDIINLIQGMLNPIGMRNPNQLKLIHQIGKDEPAFLFEMVY